MKKLIHNVLWPAAAGNVLWAFLQLAVGDGKDRDLQVLFPRLLALLFVGIYLSRDWIDTDRVHEKLADTYWHADVPMAAAIAVFAIALQAGQWWASLALSAAFLAAVVGHLRGAWDEQGMKSHPRSRRVFAAINGSGILIAGGGALLARESAWPIFIAIALVVILFLGLRSRVLARWEATKDTATAPAPAVAA